MRKILVSAAILLALAGCSSTADIGSTDTDDSPTKATSAKHTAVYKVTSKGGKVAGNVTYMTITGGKVGQEQATNAKLPWTKKVKLAGTGAFDYNGLTLVAQAGAGAKSISCQILVDGKSVAKQKSTGEYAVVTCNAS